MKNIRLLSLVCGLAVSAPSFAGINCTGYVESIASKGSISFITLVGFDEPFHFAQSGSVLKDRAYTVASAAKASGSTVTIYVSEDDGDSLRNPSNCEDDDERLVFTNITAN